MNVSWGLFCQAPTILRDFPHLKFFQQNSSYITNKSVLCDPGEIVEYINIYRATQKIVSKERSKVGSGRLYDSLQHNP